MGYEGFSTSPRMNRMHPVLGNKGEFLFLALFFPALLVLKATRTKNEDGIREALGHANNRYALFTTTNPSG